MTTNQFHLLNTRRFLPLFITQFLGAFNDNVFKNALAILISYRLAAADNWNAQILVTLAAGIFILPFFLFSATAGQLADKYKKSRLIPYVKLAEIILMLIAVIGFYRLNVSLLIFVLFLLGTQATFFGPLKYAILPEQLREHELIAGNGLIEAGTYLAILSGTILGGVLILMSFGIHLISGLICLIALVGFISSLLIPQTVKHQPHLQVNYNFVTETIKVVRYAGEREVIFISILGISWFWLVGAVFVAEFPVFAKDILGADQYVVTFFYALFSIGIGIGSMLCNQLLKGKVHTTYVPWGALGITIFTADLFFASKYMGPQANGALLSLNQFLQTVSGWRMTIDLLLIAICGGIYTVPLYAILQKKSDEAYRARVIASNNVINAFFMVIAAVATILMLKMGFSVSEVFLTLAIVNAFVAIYIRKLKI